MSNLSISAPAVPTEHHVPQNHKPPPQNPKSLSAEEHHRHLLKCYRLGNRVRREFIEALLSVDEQRLYLKLGSPSIQHYAERCFRYEPALTYEFLRVARALRRLPRLSEAFDRGEVSWSALREITRVAEEEIQEAWLEFSKSKSVRRVKAKVSDALKKGRKIPRREGGGLPNLEVRVSFERRIEEHDIIDPDQAYFDESLARR